MIIANVAVDRVTARVISCEAIPRGIVGAKVKLEFSDPAWEALSKTVVFRGAETRNTVLTGDTVTIPWETVTRAGGKLYMGVYGVGAAGKLEIPTVWTELGCIEGAASPGEESTAEPTPAFWAQISAMIGDLGTLKTETQASLVAAINELEEEFASVEGRSAYEYAVEGGFTGTEAEFAAKLGDNREFLPVPNGASAGQFLVVSSVDETGRVLGVQAVTLPDAEEGGF